MQKKLSLLGIEAFVELRRPKKPGTARSSGNISDAPKPYKLNFGPGSRWEKPDRSWLSVDIDPTLGDIVVDFQSFHELPLPSESVACVYGSHVFEHVSIFKSQRVFDEIYRVLERDGIFRLVLPDAEKSIREYLAGNVGFELFERRKARAKQDQGIEYTTFECMREDFLSPNGQVGLLGRDTLAHQNAWDFATITAHLTRAGFDEARVVKSEFQKSLSAEFSFEGTYLSEANEDYRSLYVEVVK